MENSTRKRSPTLERIMRDITADEMQETCDRMWLAIRIFDGIEAKGIWKKDLAEKMGVSEEDVSDWVSGTMDIPEETLEKLENMLDVRLLERKDDSLA